MSCKLRTRAASRSAEPVPCVWPASLAPETCARSRFDNAIYPPHFSPRRLLAVRSHGNDEERRFSSMISSFVACRLHICCTLIVECVFFLQAPNLLFSPLGSLLARQGSGRAAWDGAKGLSVSFDGTNPGVEMCRRACASSGSPEHHRVLFRRRQPLPACKHYRQSSVTVLSEQRQHKRAPFFFKKKGFTTKHMGSILPYIIYTTLQLCKYSWFYKLCKVMFSKWLHNLLTFLFSFFYPWFINITSKHARALQWDLHIGIRLYIVVRRKLC
jgi:hypothetical protein